MSERGECQLIYYSFFTSTAEKQLKVAPVRAHMCVCVRERMCVCVCVCVTKTIMNRGGFTEMHLSSKNVKYKLLLLLISY